MPKKKEKKPPFKLTCPECKHKFKADLSNISGRSDECDMCGSHDSFDITCPKCGYLQHESEI